MDPIATTAVLCLLAGCGGTPPAATPPPPTPPPTPTPAPAPAPAIDLVQLGTACGEGQPCAAPATCVTYYGIAGPRGPAFTSCEIACADDAQACPTGTTCTTIADGPGAVCRPRER